MRFVFLALIIGFLIGQACKADSLTSTVTGANNYVYRGMSYSSQGKQAGQGSPVLQGSLDYFRDDGFAASLFTGNSDTLNFDTGFFERDTELDAFLMYSKPLGDLAFGVGLNFYTYSSNDSNNFKDTNVNVSYKAFRLDHNFTDNFSGTKIPFTYTKLQFKPYLTEKLYVVSHLGYCRFENGNAVSTNAYPDYRLGVGHTEDGLTKEVSYVNTIGHEDPNGAFKYKDQSITLSISKTFDWLK